MALPDEGPCSPWLTWADVLLACPLSESDTAKIDALDAELQASLIEDASSLAYDLSERRYPGECTVTKTLCAPCTCYQRVCCCSTRSELDLGTRFPIGAVAEVIVDGVTLTDLLDYRIDNYHTLVRLNDARWPSCVDVENPESFLVTWTYGRKPPAAAVRALARLVVEEAKSCAGLKCQLPERVTSVVREGVTYVILDSFKMLDDGKTGFYPFDRWLMADKRARRVAPGMYDPDNCTTARAVDTGQPDGS